MSTILAGLSGGCREGEHVSDHSGHNHAAPSHAPAPVATAPLSGAKCAIHDVPKEWCFFCDPAVRDKGRLWCVEHHRYEDRCWKCHPELEDKKRLWCEEHALYEDECFFCHPELKPAAPVAAKDAAVLMCAEHGVPEAECAICQPGLASGLRPGESLSVRLPSAQSTALTGIETAAAATGTITDGIECLAELSFNQNRLAQIAAPVSGILQRVSADLGTQVADQQVIAQIWSASIAEAVAKAVLSHQTLDRERKLRADRVTSEAALQEAEATHRAACQQLRTLGFTEEQIDDMAQHPEEQVLMDVRAPFAGEIVERMAVRGSLVDSGKPLFTIVDRSTMWAMLQVPESSLARVEVGQTVELRVDALPSQVFTGKLTWLAPSVDDRTRLTRARAEFANPDGRLRDKMFAMARVLTRRAERAVLLPAAAIQHVAGKPFVFVQRADDLFDVRRIAPGARSGGQTEILSGVSPQEKVVVAHAFAIKSAMLISRLGAGCCED